MEPTNRTSTGLSTAGCGQPAAGAVVLAAGRSARMGRSKALLPWGDVTLVEAWAARFEELGVERVVVVLGPDAGPIRACLPSELPITWVVCEDAWSQGPRESLLAGLDRLDAGSPAWFTPVDVPVVSAEALRAVDALYIGAVDAGRGPLAVRPTCAHRPGYPVLTGPDFARHLWDGERGDLISDLLAWANRRLLEVDVLDERVTADMDLPTDYERWRPSLTSP